MAATIKWVMNGGTSIVPNLDSIAEIPGSDEQLRTRGVRELQQAASLTMVAKSGDNGLRIQRLQFPAKHGPRRALSFSRSALLPAEPVRRHRQRTHPQEPDLFFGDYQGTRTKTQGDRYGPDSRPHGGRPDGKPERYREHAGSVSGPYLANLLTQKLGYGVSANRPYYAELRQQLNVVFPNAVITACVVDAGSASFAVHPFAQHGKLRFLRVFRRPDHTGRQRRFPDRQQQQPLGNASAYYFRRLHGEQSLPTSQCRASYRASTH